MCFVFSRETYNALTTWLSDARMLASQNIVIILCGNKKDLDADREVTFLEASRFAQENGTNSSTILQSSLELKYQAGSTCFEKGVLHTQQRVRGRQMSHCCDHRKKQPKGRRRSTS